MNMVDGVVLLVDAGEGVMAQTKFVLSKALKVPLTRNETIPTHMRMLIHTDTHKGLHVQHLLTCLLFSRTFVVEYRMAKSPLLC